MCENEVKQEVRTPIDVILEMAEGEIKTHVLKCMETNSIPPTFMVRLLKSITLDVYDMKDKQLSECYVDLQKSIYESKKQEETTHGNPNEKRDESRI